MADGRARSSTSPRRAVRPTRPIVRGAWYADAADGTVDRRRTDLGHAARGAIGGHGRRTDARRATGTAPDYAGNEGMDTFPIPGHRPRDPEHRSRPEETLAQPPGAAPPGG